MIVNDGDLIIGSYDGVVVVPRVIAEQVVTLAEEMLRGENMVRSKIEDGMLASEAYRRYGLL